MNTRTSALLALTLVAGLLTGCGRSVVTAPVSIAPAHGAARAVKAPTLPDHLVIDDVLVKRTERTEAIRIKAHSDAGKLTIEFSSFFPYYIPMYGDVVLNGRKVALDEAIAVPLDKLLNEAETTALSDKDRQGLHMALYGLDFAARRLEWQR